MVHYTFEQQELIQLKPRNVSVATALRERERTLFVFISLRVLICVVVCEHLKIDL